MTAREMAERAFLAAEKLLPQVSYDVKPEVAKALSEAAKAAAIADFTLRIEIGPELQKFIEESQEKYP